MINRLKKTLGTDYTEDIPKEINMIVETQDHSKVIIEKIKRLL